MRLSGHAHISAIGRSAGEAAFLKIYFRGRQYEESRKAHFVHPDDCPGQYYSGTELRKQILDSVSEYNESAKDERISLNSCKVSKKKARVILKYKSLEDYASFNNVLAWSGTLTTAIENGYFDKSTAVISSDGTLKTTIGELESKFGGKTASRRGNDLHVLIVEEPLMIKVPGKIRYTIGDVTMEGGYAITGAGSLTTLLDEPCYIIYK